MQIVHIDDEDLYLEHYGHWLSQAGFRHIPVKDPIKAVDTIRKVQPNAVLLDIVMPDLNGIDILARLKADEQINQIPVILLTYMPYELSGARAQELGAYAYLSKRDHNADAIATLLESLLNTSQETRAY